MAVDATTTSFDQDVIQRSRDVPVVVDFWAAWCGPCRALTPALERAAGERAGKVELVKVDVDANQDLAARYGVQGIPAVKAFKDGGVVDEFVGAIPQAEVERFFDRIVPSEADALAAEGDEQSLRRALELDPRRVDAGLALARILADRGEREDALAILAEFPGSFGAEGLAARLRLEDDPEVAAAFAALDAGEQQRGLDGLIAAIAATDDADRREELRRAVVGVLDELGVEHPLARESRRKLASALY